MAEGREVEIWAIGNIEASELHSGEVAGQFCKVQMAPKREPLQLGQVRPCVGYLFQPHEARAVHGHCQGQFCQLQCTGQN